VARPRSSAARPFFVQRHVDISITPLDLARHQLDKAPVEQRLEG